MSGVRGGFCEGVGKTETSAAQGDPGFERAWIRGEIGKDVPGRAGDDGDDDQQEREMSRRAGLRNGKIN